MYEAYLSEKSMIPHGQLIEIRFEEFEKDIEAHMKLIYEKLALGDISPVMPKYKKYLEGQKEYRKNQYSKMPDVLAEKLINNWSRFFDEWGYSKDYSISSYTGEKQAR